ncbi:MAG: DoxX family protein [Thermoguttaceae bacterium]|jgi:uncharacterized membrane protein YphA (DoxX/SURF4 family)
MATVVLLVALRLSLGCHFLYEGVWKFKHPVQFAAETEGFLAGARGPLSGMFFAMVPDIDGRQRLEGKLETVELEMKDADGKAKKAKAELVKNEARTKQYEALRDRFLAGHADLADPAQEAFKKHVERTGKNLAEEAQEVFAKHLQGTEKYLAEHWSEIQAHFAALGRFEDSRRTSPGADFQKKRDRDQMMKLRGEAKVWLVELDARQEAYKSALRELLTAKKAEAEPAAGGAPESPGPDPLAAGWNPFRWTRMQLIQFAITWGLTAIGVCLMLGLCTRPAALGGGLFMLFVVMSQPSYPGVIPPDPPQLGHALLVNKDFVEMIALFLLATTAAGRWGGLDYFLENYLVCPLLSRFGCQDCSCDAAKKDKQGAQR